MTRDEIYAQCVEKIAKTNALLMELATGTGKSFLSIRLSNYLLNSKYYEGREEVNILILVAKRVHKQTWKDEIEKWGGIHHPTAKVNIRMECYESMHKCADKRYDILIEDECFRGDTEILTDTGYKQFKDLTEEDLVAQFTQEGNIEFVKPLRLIKKHHTGEICKLHLGRERYCYMTPNHNIVYKTPWVDGWRMKPVKDLCRNGKVTIPVSGCGTGCNNSLTTLERLYIAIQADGTLQRHQLNESVYSIQVTRSRKKERLKALLADYDNWTEIKGRENTDRYMIKFPKGDAKLLSTHFDINMGYLRANDFINEVIEWDGCDKMSPVESVYYSSVVKENADFVAAVAVQAGYKALVSVEEDNRKDTFNPVYRVFMRRTTEVPTMPMTKEYLSYDDDVYCVEVPSHMIVVRSEGYTFIAGNCHHVGSESRLETLKALNFGYLIGLSATIPRKLKQLFKYRYHAEIVSCDIVEAIEDDILPEPQILLFPLMLDNRQPTETIELNKPKDSYHWLPGDIKHPQPIYGEYKDLWKYKKSKQHAILRCTQKQKLIEFDKLIEWFKKQYMMRHSEALKQSWLFQAGKRLEFLAYCKNQIVSDILKKLDKQRTITFCKTIEQSEVLGKYCIHSQNGKADEIYDKFNQKKINHITAVNILNENANLVDCKYAIFANLSSSEICMPQRLGKL